MMMAANLVGFVIGTDGMQYMLRQIADSWDGEFLRWVFLGWRKVVLTIRRCLGCTGLKFMVVACVCLFVGVQVMFEYR